VTEDNEWRVDDEDYEVDIDGALEDLRSAVVLVLARFGVPAQGDCARPNEDMGAISAPRMLDSRP
jgi:hypothetical protein